MAYRWHPDEYKDKKEDTVRQFVKTLMRFKIVQWGIFNESVTDIHPADAVTLFHDLFEYWEEV
jgi:hypothetical protein